MNVFIAAVLGIVQGLTEFLPVSSSGHLVIFQSLFPSFKQPGILFDVILHFGTLLSVVVYFNKKIVSAFIKNFWFLIIASIPAALLGFMFDDFFESLFASTLLVGFEFLINALLSYLVSVTQEKGKVFDVKNSLLVGIAQAISISPGISRSGSTIFAGSALGIDKKEVAEFSFFLSIPAILGANLLQIIKYGQEININLYEYGIGLFTSFLFGLIAIKMVMEFIQKGKFKIFAVYSLVVGVLIIALSL